MNENTADLCPEPSKLPPQATQPLTAPIYAASVYECDSPAAADAMLGGRQPGYVYSRDGHPNADLLADKCRRLHAAERAAVATSGMAALALAVVSQLKSGDHVVVSNRLYGRTLALIGGECERLGIGSTLVDTCNLAATKAACTAATRMIVVETITNPLLRVSDLPALAEIAHAAGAVLLVDNTLASPIVCRPIEFGADLVHESLTKIMNGHSDALLGLLCGRERLWERVPGALSTWGWSASPFDCWLVLRGISTLHLRATQAGDNALRAAEFLRGHKHVELVSYPGLAEHPDHALARRQFGERFGSLVAFSLRGGAAAAERFIAAARRIPFCPSLGELSTTLSHPRSTSHRGLSEAARAALGITPGMIRLSVGIESPEHVRAALKEGLRGLD